MDTRICLTSFLLNRAKKFKMQCLWCGKEFVVSASVYNSGHGKFCRNSCSFKHQTENSAHPRWKGGIIKRGKYTYVYLPTHPHAGKQGYIAEHRIIIENILGRHLRKREVVHHINHDASDNRAENLVLCKSAGQHTVEYHKEVLVKMSKLCIGREPWNKGRRR